MPDELPPHVPTRRQELLLRVARNPEICCCCVCLSHEDRRRARRVFRITRRVGKAWKEEQKQRQQEAR